MEEFPSNTQKDKAPGNAPKKEEPVQKVIEGRVVRQKKPLGRRFKEFFKPDDDVRVGEYVIFDVLIPAAKDMIVDAVTSGVERKFYGEVRSHTRRTGSRYGSAGHTPYHQMSRSSSSRREESRHGISRRGRATHDFDEFIFESRVQADEVLAQMHVLLEKYEVVSVADFFNLVGETPTYQDRKWGWFDLFGTSTQRVGRGGYLLNLPRPEPID